MSISSDDAFRDLLRRRGAMLSQSSLLPLAVTLKGNDANELRDSLPIAGKVLATVEPPAVPFTLEPTANGRLRFVPQAPLAYTPVAILIGPELHTLINEAAQGVIEYPKVERKTATERPAAELLEIPLAADDRPTSPDAASPFATTCFSGESDYARWTYDTSDPEDCLEIAVRAPAHDSTPVWAEVRLESRDNPLLNSVRYVRMTGRPSADGFLRTNVFDVAPHSLGDSVSVRVAMVRTRDPEQTEIVLSEKKFAAIPFTADADGGWSCPAPRADQWAAASDPHNDWALRVVANQEVRS
ncbi:MAG: hypothetical protein U1A77_21565 [Pirellulales bacterium]